MEEPFIGIHAERCTAHLFWFKSATMKNNDKVTRNKKRNMDVPFNELPERKHCFDQTCCACSRGCPRRIINMDVEVANIDHDWITISHIRNIIPPITKAAIVDQKPKNIDVKQNFRKISTRNHLEIFCGRLKHDPSHKKCVNFNITCAFGFCQHV